MNCLTCENCIYAAAALQFALGWMLFVLFLFLNISIFERFPILFWMTWQIGKTKVFLRAGQMAELDTRRAEVLGNAARKIQRHGRTYIARKEFISYRNAAIQIQSWCRGMFLLLIYSRYPRTLNCMKTKVFQEFILIYIQGH